MLLNGEKRGPQWGPRVIFLSHPMKNPKGVPNFDTDCRAFVSTELKFRWSPFLLMTRYSCAPTIWVCLKMLCTPLYPMVLLIIIPDLHGYFIGNINPTFSGPNPNCCPCLLTGHRSFLGTRRRARTGPCPSKP